MAYGALLIWPVITVVLFQTMPYRKAIIWSLLGAYLFLPMRTEFDLPGFPNMDKMSIPNLSTLICALLFARGPVLTTPRSLPLLLVVAIFVISPFFTALTNTDPVILSFRALPALTWYDGISQSAGHLIELIPFLIAYGALSRAEDHEEILRALIWGAIIYAPLMLFEIRMSPQLHRMIYGFFPHEFAQQIRFGGFRPVVFLGHGLVVALFVSLAFLAAMGLRRQRARIWNFSADMVSTGLFVLLLLCKSLGALIIAVAIAPLTLMRRRTIIVMAAIAATTLVTYPALRGAGLVPVQAVASFASDVSEERSESFGFRLENEENLLARAAQRPWFGWGGWGRNQIFQKGYETDIRTSVTDGRWIISIGQFGWVGYIACFGLLCYPFLHMFRVRKQPDVAFATLALLIVLLANLIDLIPNSSLNPITWMIVGALSGTVQRQAKAQSPVPHPRKADVKS